MGSVRVVFMFSALFMAFRWTDISAQINCIMKSNTSCAECVSNITCLWCSRTQQCLDYPVRTLLPPHSLCPLNDARWGNCWVNFQTLIITMCVIGGVIIISVFICCFCCCKCENFGSKRTNEHVEREAEIRRVRHGERKAEMRSRHDEIRKKYGLMKENPYSRFENN
ncbi:PTTG1 interacting protein b [Ictalurus punctatus]|uniref:PTTG1 interacting protein b n=1 Tax=Ictalurus punctatus TaxID=7998 RepID=A0A2D0R540_ICTPU|nr:PTTG1 interacting protein b [Ictalurus punctatus]